MHYKSLGGFIEMEKDWIFQWNGLDGKVSFIEDFFLVT